MGHTMCTDICLLAQLIDPKKRGLETMALACIRHNRTAAKLHSDQSHPKDGDALEEKTSRSRIGCEEPEVQ